MMFSTGKDQDMDSETDLIDTLKTALKPFPSLDPVFEDVRNEIQRLRAVEDLRHATLLAEKSGHERTKKDLAALAEENDVLRRQLHASELDVARMRGYQDRVREFDPVSDREAYADNLPRRHDAVERHGSLMAANTHDFAATCQRPWFARRA